MNRLTAPCARPDDIMNRLTAAEPARRHHESSHRPRTRPDDITNRLTGPAHTRHHVAGTRHGESSHGLADRAHPDRHSGPDTHRDDSRCRPNAASAETLDGTSPMRRGATPIATPTRHSLDMAIPTTPSFQPRRPLVAGAIVEEWWCPVCDRAAHRIHRPGRPRIYCSNACRQRAYRYRRAHGLRTTATDDQPPESARVPFGRRHALRARGDFMSTLSDARRRRVTVCGVLAKPTRYSKLRHFDFLLDSGSSCRTCVQLVRPERAADPADRATRLEHRQGPRPPLRPWITRVVRRTGRTARQPRPIAGQVPVHSGGRFSANAFGPSLASFDVNTWP